MPASATTHPRFLVPGEPARRLGLVVVCLLLVGYFGVSFDNFLTVDNGLATAQNISAIAIAAVGATALLTSGNVDLSIGGQYALLSVLTATVAQETGSPPAAVAAGVLLGAALGLLNGMLVRTLSISPLIVTLGTLSVFHGLAFVFSDGVSVADLPQGFLDVGRSELGPVPMPVVVATLIFLVGGWLLLRTVTGLRIYAIGGNSEAARLTGIRVSGLVTRLYVLNGALMGVVAILTTARLGSGSPDTGIGFELDVLTAVILGGVAFTGGGGHPLGVLAGVATIGVLNTGLVFEGLQDWWQEIAKGSLLLLALAADQVAQHRRARRAVRRDAAAGEPRTTAAGGLADALRHRPPPPEGEPILECRGLTKTYGSVQALRDADLRVRAGEVTCLLGDNGAGKSTLIKCLTGVVRPEAGEVRLGGRPVILASPRDARAAGIETVYQDLALCPNLGVAHNLILGSEPRTKLGGLLPVRDDRAAGALAERRLGELGIELNDLNAPVRALSGGQRQSVAIARAMREDVEVVILDEPTAALGVSQTRNVLRLVDRIAARGAAVILITHDIETVQAVADRVVVLRLGAVVHEGPVTAVTQVDLVHLMAGLPANGAGVEAPAPEPR